MATAVTARPEPLPAPMLRPWRAFRSPATLTIATLGGLVALAGAFMPWAERTFVVGGATDTVLGIDADGGRVLWMAIAVLFAGWLGLFNVRFASLLAALGAAGIIILVLVRATDLDWVPAATEATTSVSAGGGLWVSLAGAVLALLAALVPVAGAPTVDAAVPAGRLTAGPAWPSDDRIAARLGPALQIVRIGGLLAFVVLMVLSLTVEPLKVEWIRIVAGVGLILALAAWWALGREWRGWEPARLFAFTRRNGKPLLNLGVAFVLFVFATFLIGALTSKSISANAIVQGILVGGGYALMAAGLSLIFGVMRLVNLAHGDFIVLVAYGIWYLISGHPAAAGTEMPILVGFLVMLPIAAVVGFVLQLSILNRTLKSNDLLVPLLVTFGMAIIIQNGLQEMFSADNRSINLGDVTNRSFSALGVTMGVVPLGVFAAAILLLGALSYLFYGTKLGRLLRATSDNATTVQLMGVNPRRIYAIAMAVSFVVVVFAALAMGAQSQFSPFSGPINLLYAFEAVVIGGLGSLWGTLAGGIILGVSQGIGAELDPGWQQLTGHLVFVAIILVRPRGLFPK